MHSSENSPLNELAADTVVVAVEVLEELTEEEKAERHRLELKIERAFYEAGCALKELRDRRLYRSTHKTFEEYCRDRFHYSRDAAYLKIAAAVVCDNIQKFLPTNGYTHIHKEIKQQQQRFCN
ncbi:MAG: hypothetical protein SAK29_05610, partial [Scytonema sp. PMC 1069.18]|nr:hypothetical protein [Scytonema sp. PMC 1069.18]MEC4884597.1 hypothetical protein [Scytonema sp. PMC 1070.18]